ncbi:glycosyltransferase family 2 protein [Demequina iriomotensis]|uniref:glycosyltransferase family 2 protein n=1 Tax=Demequina iriomotensis TaxID=1536641 RepID=UPI00078563BE|nr:glycosyltransferase [Demequina iriomotensis]
MPDTLEETEGTMRSVARARTAGSAPLLEAIVPSFNAEATLGGAVDSAVAVNGIPVVVVDDGSTDGSAARLAARDGLRVLRQSNSGPSVARNRGVLASRAEFVMFLDSDDQLLPGFREEFERHLALHPEADVFICGMTVIDDDGATVGHHTAASLEPTPWESVLRGESVPTNGIVIRRAVLARAGLFSRVMWHSEDIDLWLRVALATGAWVRMDHTLAVYRLSSGSLSKSSDLMWRGARQAIRATQRRAPDRRAARRAARHGRRAATRYAYRTSVARDLRAAARTSTLAAARKAVTLPPQFWPLVARDAFSSVAAGR